MRFSLRGKVLCDAASKMQAVASGEVAQDFSNARRVTIEVKGQHKVTFVTSNGHTTARLILTADQDPWLKTTRTGKVTVDSGVLKKLAQTVGGAEAGDHVIELYIDGDDLLLADTLTAKRGQLPKLKSHHQFSAEVQLNDVTSNGHTTARLILTADQDPWLKTTRTGKVTVDSGVLKKLAQTVGGAEAGDHVIELYIDGDDLLLADTLTAKRGQLPKLKSHHQFSAEVLKGETYSIDAGIFRRGIAAVSRYTTTYAHKVRYHMVYVHLTDSDTRFVCGSGARFAIASYASDGGRRHEQREAQFILPARQAEIISGLIADAQRVDFTYPSRRRCHIQPDTNIDMVLDGIPGVDYIPYEQNAYRHCEARCLVDLKRENLDEALRHIEAARDIEIEKEGVFHSVVFGTSLTSTELCVADGRFQCSTPLPAQSYFLGNTQLS